MSSRFDAVSLYIAFDFFLFQISVLLLKLSHYNIYLLSQKTFTTFRKALEKPYSLSYRE